MSPGRTPGIQQALNKGQLLGIPQVLVLVLVQRMGHSAPSGDREVSCRKRCAAPSHWPQVSGDTRMGFYSGNN